MTINLKTPCVDRKGQVVTDQSFQTVDGKPKLIVQTPLLSDVIADHFERHPNSKIPSRKLMAWAIELDKDGIVNVKDDDIGLFVQAVDECNALPFVKYQVQSIMESKT